MANNDASKHVVENDKNYLGPTSVTSDHLQLAFREYLKDDGIKLTKVDTEIIGAGQGFTSFILRLRTTWSDENKTKHGSKLPKSVILKAISKDALEKLFQNFNINGSVEGREMMATMLAKAHQTECSIYELFGGKNVNLPVPTALSYALWHGEDSRPPMILLEDLGDRGRVLGDGSGSLTYPQMLSLAEALANLHAWCMTTDVNWRNSLETFVDRMQLMAAFVPMMVEGMKKAKAMYPDVFGNLDENKTMALMTVENMAKSHESYKEWNMPDVLVHADFWANNILFNKLPDGGMGDKLIALIDWQMTFVGNPFYDIGRVASMSLDAELRKAHFEDILKRYYDTLVQKLGPGKIPKEMTFDRVLKAAQEQAALNCLFLLLMQDTLNSLFAPGDTPEDEIKREKLKKRSKDGIEFAIAHLDVAVSNDKLINSDK